MKDFDKKRPDKPGKNESPVAGPAKTKGRGMQEKTRPGILSNEHLQHPANAGPLADLLGQLQRDYGNLYVQRLVSSIREAKSLVKPQTDGGQSLDSSVRAEMEAAFGEDFGNVRVHTDNKTQEDVAELGARSFTRGADIYFGKGEYDPSTRAGKELIAHELAHVVQQKGNPADQPSLSVDQAGDAFEQEADHAAAAVLSGGHPHVTSRTGVPTLQRKQGEALPPTITTTDEVAVAVGHGTWLIGSLSVNYFYSVDPNANLDTLTLSVAAGVGVAVNDLMGVGARVNDTGGAGPRAVIISIPRQAETPRRIQITFTWSSRIYIVFLRFPQQSPALPPPRSPQTAAPDQPSPEGHAPNV